MGGAAHVTATAAVVDVRIRIRLAAIGGTAVAIAVTCVARNTAGSRGARGRSIGAVTNGTAAAAIGGTCIRVDFATVCNRVVAVGVTRVARNLASA